MKRTLVFLEMARIFYLSKLGSEKPDVCPFNAVAEFEGRLYISTNKNQTFCDYIKNDTEVEISCISNGEWLRLFGEVKEDKRLEAKEALMKTNPTFKQNLQSNRDAKVLYFTKGTASFFTATEKPIQEYLA